MPVNIAAATGLAPSSGLATSLSRWSPPLFTLLRPRCLRSVDGDRVYTVRRIPDAHRRGRG
uniref:Uncharacterized protein n=1 Tax=Nothobranchius pienaari TaxID=704102 RepID=A0A1A8PAN6_9TELE